jgi:hypothetical protein
MKCEGKTLKTGNINLKCEPCQKKPQDSEIPSQARTEDQSV